jgi:hypothetical protein
MIFSWENASISSMYVGADNIKTTCDVVTFQGTYAPIVAGNLAGKYVVGNKDGKSKIYTATANTTMKGFRAYFELPEGSSARLMFNNGDGTTTSISAVEFDQDNESIYNLQGQKVQNTGKGLYIINGKKVVRK